MDDDLLRLLEAHARAARGYDDDAEIIAAAGVLARFTTLHAELLDVAESAQKLSAALTACEPYFQTAAILMQRMGPYTGPTFGAEHEALRAALARLEGRT